MFQFIESIRIKEGIIEHLDYHQSRVIRTFLNFGKPPFFQLNEIITPNALNAGGVVKCRVKYDLQQVLDITYSAYAVKKIGSISLVELEGRKYDFKYADRGWITNLLLNAGTDEIIMTDRGIIKDASYANLAFYDGKRWYTPQTPLLEGTQRAFLLDSNKIQVAEIRTSNLHQYQMVKFINAMMTWEESPTIPMSLLT
jgi:4-amino-4-deoxychorismate lyase